MVGLGSISSIEARLVVDSQWKAGCTRPHWRPQCRTLAAKLAFLVAITSSLWGLVPCLCGCTRHEKHRGPLRDAAATTAVDALSESGETGTLFAVNMQSALPMKISDGIGIQVGQPIWNKECALDFWECVAQLPVVVRTDQQHMTVRLEMTKPDVSFRATIHYKLPRESRPLNDTDTLYLQVA
jgi:hypothetical protein